DDLLRDRLAHPRHGPELTARGDRRDRLGELAERLRKRAVCTRFERVLAGELAQIRELFESAGDVGIVHDRERLAHVGRRVSIADLGALGEGALCYGVALTSSEYTVTENLDGARLDKAVIELMKGELARGMSRAKVKRAIEAGEVRVNGRRRPKG